MWTDVAISPHLARQVLDRGPTTSGRPRLCSRAAFWALRAGIGRRTPATPERGSPACAHAHSSQALYRYNSFVFGDCARCGLRILRSAAASFPGLSRVSWAEPDTAQTRNGHGRCSLGLVNSNAIACAAVRAAPLVSNYLPPRHLPAEDSSARQALALGARPDLWSSCNQSATKDGSMRRSTSKPGSRAG
jgi:hypothetical protein